MPSTGAGPTFSLARTSQSAVWAIDSLGSKSPSSPVSGWPGMKRTAGQPCSTYRSASSTASGPMGAPDVTKHGTESRCAPPSSW